MLNQFYPASEIERMTFFDILQKNNSNCIFNKNYTKILVQDLPFTDNWQRLVFEDVSTKPHVKKDYLYDGTSLIACVYSDDPYENNNISKMNITMTKQNAMFYLKFFCDYWVQGQDRIIPVTYMDEIDWQDDISPMMKQSLNDEIRRYPIIEQNNNNFNISVICVFRQSLMIITFNIEKSGVISITDRKSHIEDLPIRNFA
jgi:hypothetical protein